MSGNTTGTGIAQQMFTQSRKGRPGGIMVTLLHRTVERRPVCTSGLGVQSIRLQIAVERLSRRHGAEPRRRHFKGIPDDQMIRGAFAVVDRQGRELTV